MVQSPCTSIRGRRRIGSVLGYLAVALAAALPAVALAAPSGAASISTQLAADTSRLAESRAELGDVRSELRRVARKHRVLRGRITKRMVAIYVSGGAVESIAQIASTGSMRDVGTSLDTLDVVARHQEREISQWRKLGKRASSLRARRTKLVATIKDAEQDVERGRAKLLKAQHAADKARESAAAMALRADSPLLTKIGHPETTAVRVADEAMGNADAGAADSATQPLGFRQDGIASMYADSFTGERTANGERYDPNAFTAAHPSLPFGTWVTVRGPAGSIVVRVNDRGPFVGGRVIDLSRAAANAVGLGGGIASVTLTVDA